MSTLGPIDPDLVRSRADLISFLDALARDFVENNDEWERDEVGDYLRTAARWVDDASRAGMIEEEASWAAFASILYAAKIYE